MKSLIKVLVVFWISQSVLCNVDEISPVELEVNSTIAPITTETQFLTTTISPLKSLVKSGFFISDNEIVRALHKMVQNCDVANMTELFEKVKLLERSEAITVDEKLEELQFRCSNKEVKQNMIDTYTEVSTFLQNCIDPKYNQTVNKLHSAVLNMQDLICKTNKEEFHKMMIDNDGSEQICLEDNIIQIASCFFVEETVTRFLRNASKVIDFTVMLIEGKDYECGVVDRIEKCIQKTIKNCENFPEIIFFGVNMALESFGCKLNETTDLNNEIATEPLRLDDFRSFQQKVKSATNECDDDKFTSKMSLLMMNLEAPIRSEMKSNDKEWNIIYKSICKVPEQKLLVLHFIDEITEELKNCMNTKYVEYVEKLVKPIKRAIDIKCQTMDQDDTLILNYSMKDELTECIDDKFIVFPLLGCVFSSEYARDIVADSSMLRNFTMNLLGGEDKECGIINEIQKCVALTLDTCKDKSFSNFFKYVSDLAIISMECKTDFLQNTIIAPSQKAKYQFMITPFISSFRSRFFDSDNEIVRALHKMVQNCNEANMTKLFDKVILLEAMEANILDVEGIKLQHQCSSKKMIDAYNEVSTFFQNCIDPKYIQTVNKLHSAVLNMKDLMCKKYTEELHKVIKENDDSEKICLKDNVIQIASCFFVEGTVIRLSNASQVIDFTVMLIEGNDNECEVVNRIEKCIQKTVKNCESFPEIIFFGVKIALESFGCKFNETTDLNNETALEPLRLDDIQLLKQKVKSATNECDDDKFHSKMRLLMMNLEAPIRSEMKSNDKDWNIINKSICKVPQRKLLVLQFIDEITEDLKNCINTKYVEYVGKLVKPIKRAIDIKCQTMDQYDTSILNYLMKDKNKECFEKKLFPLLGCVFSSEYVRGIFADSSMLRNFTMNLLGGENKECGSINEIQKCVASTLDTCENKSLSNLFKYVSGVAITSMGCETDFLQNTIIANDIEVLSSTTELSTVQIAKDISKQFTFNNFNEAFGFMTRVAFYAAEIKYYPLFTNENTNVSIVLRYEDLVKQQQMDEFIETISNHKK